MMKIEKLALILVLAGIMAMGGCIYTSDMKEITPLGPANGSQANDSQANGAQTDKTAATGSYPNAALGGTFETGDAVEYLGVKGKIVVGGIVNGKVPDYLQINNDTATLLTYASANTTYGPTAIVHYPQRGTGEGEADIYVNGELIATMKYSRDASFNGYATIACEPGKYLEYTLNFTIKRYGECSRNMTLNAGKACTDNSQCEGFCISENASSVSGECSGTEYPLGCFFQMQEGVSMELCVD
jgi:hypothetical protein